MRRGYVDFVPSSYSYPSYGAEIPEGYELVEKTEKVPVGEQITQWLPAAKSILGLDDPQDLAVKLENRLRDLRHGNQAEKAAAMVAAGSPFSLKGAIEKTEKKLREARAQARQTKTRDMLYTGLAATGVIAGLALTAWLGAKAYREFMSTR
jgi:hypothetical protein